HGFGVGGTAKPIQSRTEFAMIVEFAVVSDPARSIIAGHRLRTGFGEIHNGQAPMPKSNSVPEKETLGVRAPVTQHPRHSLDQTPVNRPVRISVLKNPRDAAHGLVLCTTTPQFLCRCGAG